MSDEMDKSQAAMRIAQIIEICLESEASYKLFNSLAEISQWEVKDKLRYLLMLREIGTHDEDQIQGIAFLILTGSAQYFKDMINRGRDAQVQREIEEMTQ